MDRPNHNPKVSVVIPCYNGEKYLRAAIDSALGQTFEDKEIIIVNDGSIDKSAQVVSEYGEKVILINQDNQGLSAARNTGVRNSKGTILAFLDSDDYWEPEFLEKMVAALETENATLAYCGWQNIGLTGGRGLPYVPPDYQNRDHKIRDLVENPGWPVHAAVIRKQAVVDAGLFNTDLKCCEDFDLWLRTVITGKITLVPYVLAYYRHHGNQMTSNRLKLVITHYNVQKAFLDKNREIRSLLGADTVLDITLGRLRKEGYVFYWARDIESARFIFRMLMKEGYVKRQDIKYFLPSILPYRLHYALLANMDRAR